MKRLFLLLTVLMSTPAYSGDSVEGKVLSAGIYGSGRLFVMLDQTIAEPGCANTRFDVAAGHEQIETWLSIAMAAAISGKTVRVKTNGCFAVYPTMTPSEDTWFYIFGNK